MVFRQYLREQENVKNLPVFIMTGKDLTADEVATLRRDAKQLLGRLPRWGTPRRGAKHWSFS